MSNHTINSWKKFCLHHKHVIEDLHKRAIGNAERRTAPEDMDTSWVGATEATGTGASVATGTGVSEETRTVAGDTNGAVTGGTTATVNGKATDTAAGNTTGTGATGATLPTPQQANPHRSLPPLPLPPPPPPPPPPPYEKVAGPKPVSVKTEPLDEDQLDFAFAADVLAGWNANEESDAALWKRMESMVRPPAFHSVCGMANTSPSGLVPAPRRGRYFAREIGPGLNTSLRASQPRREDDSLSTGLSKMAPSDLSALSVRSLAGSDTVNFY